jgi:hypothetical protein
MPFNILTRSVSFIDDTSVENQSLFPLHQRKSRQREV